MADRLAAAGHDVVHARNLGLTSAPDRVVLAATVEEDRVLVTLDTDFGALVAHTGICGPEHHPLPWSGDSSSHGSGRAGCSRISTSSPRTSAVAQSSSSAMIASECADSRSTRRKADNGLRPLPQARRRCAPKPTDVSAWANCVGFERNLPGSCSVEVASARGSRRRCRPLPLRRALASPDRRDARSPSRSKPQHRSHEA